MASQSEEGCKTIEMTVPEQLKGPSNGTPRPAIRVVSLHLKGTLEGFGSEQIKGVAGWDDHICVATDRFLVLFDDSDVKFDGSDDFSRRADMALPPEISHVVTIAAGSVSLFILSDWIWTLSKGHKFRRWIEAPNVSGISVSSDDSVLLAENPAHGNATLSLYDDGGDMQRKFILPCEYEGMQICQAELPNDDDIVMSIRGRGKSRVLLMDKDGIVRRVYDASMHESLSRDIQDNGDISVHSQCQVPYQFIALGDFAMVFVAETYPPCPSGSSKSSCQACKEKLVLLDKNFQLNQILLPDFRLNFRNYNRICIKSSRYRLLVICMKVSGKDGAKSGEHNEVLTPVVNVYKLISEIESDCEDESKGEAESEIDDESKP